jgi:D-beta-D-heptose 7-phosphate kinase/D-beta-D-heptose 1-phosphate adenosyltransferase
MRPGRGQAFRPARTKLRSHQALISAVRRHRAARRRVVFTNGCFDLLHAGHVTLLQRARALGDVLVVAVNSDRSVRALKGPGRPIVGERDRALLLGALECVDHVTLFDAATPQRLIEQLRPDILIKGADWRTAGIIGRAAVEQAGGRVVRLPLVAGRSTTGLIERIRQQR